MASQNSLLSIVYQTAQRYPEKIALIVDGKAINYKDLINLSESWASRLLAQTSQPSLTRVAVYGYRSLTSYVGVLAAMMTGAAFVPLNPRLPLQRNLMILEQAQVDALIIDSHAEEQLAQLSKVIDLPYLRLLPHQSEETNEPEMLRKPEVSVKTLPTYYLLLALLDNLKVYQFHM